jgi:hypothetical protein
MPTRLCLVCFALLLPAAAPAVEIVQLTNENWAKYAPPGKEADCILGDYVLKSDRVWAVVAQPTPWRNANMTVRQVGGAVIDLTTTSRPNDQLSAFYPGIRKFPFDKAVVEAATGKEVVLVVTSPAVAATPAAEGKPAVAAQPAVRLTYRLRDGESYLLVSTVYANEQANPLDFTLEDEVRADNFDAKARNAHHDLFWVHDRYFRQAYGVLADDYQIKSISDATRISRLEYIPKEAAGGRVTLKPGLRMELVRRLIPGPDLLAVKDEAMLLRKAKTHALAVTVADALGRPVAGADVILRDEDDEEYGSGKTDGGGKLRCTLPAEEKLKLTVRSVGRGAKTEPIHATADRGVEFKLPVAPLVIGVVTDDQGRPIPCKVQFKGVKETPNPNWGPTSAVEWVNNLVYTPNGRFSVPINPGEYEAIVSYGPEYDVVRLPLKIVRADDKTEVKLPFAAKLKRSVHTPGWISTDFHSHASPSGDNTAEQLGRVLNLLAEHIEFAPCTEHNRLDSYTPHLKALGAEKLMGTCVGIELTGTPLPLNHQNAFPMVLKPRTQDSGAPLTDVSPEVQIRRLYEWDDKGEKLVQQNHPDIGWLFFDKDGDGKPDGGYKNGFPYMHVIEVHPIHEILDLNPTRIAVDAKGKKTLYNSTIFNWLQLLNQGYRIPGVVNTDAHYNFHGSGGIRNWVRCDTQTPGDIDPLDIVRQSKKGRIIMSTGPYLEVKLNDALPGDDLGLPKGQGTLHVRVQCPNWFDIDRVQVLVNGRPDPKLNFTRKTHAKLFGDGNVKFDQKLEVKLEKDAHIIVVAVGEEATLGDVMGPFWGRQNPAALSNPIFVDVDGGGFKANGDTLSAPLPIKGGNVVK